MIIWGLPMQTDDWLTLPDLKSKPKYIRWLLMLAIWACWATVVFASGSKLAGDIADLFFVLFGLSASGFFLSLAFCLVEWIIRSALHWQKNTHIAHTPWMPPEIEAQLFFLPIFKFSGSWFLLFMVFGFAVAATGAIVYLISSGQFGFMGTFGWGAAHM